VNYTALTPYVQAVPIDEGFIDYRSFLADMRSSGFGGSVAYEMCSPLAGGRQLGEPRSLRPAVSGVPAGIPRRWPGGGGLTMPAPRIQTTTVGSYPIPDWLTALPSDQARTDAPHDAGFFGRSAARSSSRLQVK